MDPILTRCGYRCDLCLAYRPNVEAKPENAKILSAGWFKYFGFLLDPAEIHCDGCMAENPHLIDQACPVRPCVIERGLENCADCADYVCPRLTERLVDVNELKQKAGGEIPVEEYRLIIWPYENKRRLELIRAQKSAGTEDNPVRHSCLLILKKHEP